MDVAPPLCALVFPHGPSRDWSIFWAPDVHIHPDSHASFASSPLCDFARGSISLFPVSLWVARWLFLRRSFLVYAGSICEWVVHLLLPAL